MSKQFFVDLKDLAREKISFEASFEPGLVQFGSDNIQQIGLLSWTAVAERAGNEIRIAGSLNTSLELPCSRCLEPSRIAISKPFELFFRERDEAMFDEEEEIELNDKDTRTAFFTGKQLAITDILREQILLALPMKTLCTVDCKGLCPHCGINLNSGSCNCAHDDFSPHMDTLVEIKRRLEQGTR